MLDAYNANPTSMQAALESFIQFDTNLKAVILGDMFEVGEDTIKEHKIVIQQTLALNFDTILVCGNAFFEANQQLQQQVISFKNYEDLAEHLKKHPLTHKSILIKGSRGMALERCLAIL